MKTDIRSIVGQIFERTFSLDRAGIDAKNRTVDLSFSSEQPVETRFGIEILDHSQEAVDLSRLKDGAALLIEHSRTDQVGVIVDAGIVNRRGVAKVRFVKSA